MSRLNVPTDAVLCCIDVMHADHCTCMKAHQESMSVKCIPPHTLLLYRETGVYRGIPIFSYF